MLNQFPVRFLEKAAEFADQNAFEDNRINRLVRDVKIEEKQIQQKNRRIAAQNRAAGQKRTAEQKIQMQLQQLGGGGPGGKGANRGKGQGKVRFAADANIGDVGGNDAGNRFGSIDKSKLDPSNLMDYEDFAALQTEEIQGRPKPGDGGVSLPQTMVVNDADAARRIRWAQAAEQYQKMYPERCGIGMKVAR
jgi:hypothetical protein